MKIAEQQREIALACSWSVDDIERGYSLDQFGEVLPFYPGCLNAMHKAEQVLTDGQWLIYEHYLQLPSALRGDYGHRHIINASAEQKAEAFLRTIGKWKEE
jgi:hypothetical protein